MISFAYGQGEITISTSERSILEEMKEKKKKWLRTRRSLSIFKWNSNIFLFLFLSIISTVAVQQSQAHCVCFVVWWRAKYTNVARETGFLELLFCLRLLKTSTCPELQWKFFAWEWYHPMHSYALFLVSLFLLMCAGTVADEKCHQFSRSCCFCTFTIQIIVAITLQFTSSSWFSSYVSSFFILIPVP